MSLTLSAKPGVRIRERMKSSRSFWSCASGIATTSYLSKAARMPWMAGSGKGSASDAFICRGGSAAVGKATATTVSQSDDLITITTPAMCECSDEYLGTLMDRRMRLIAGNDALDCGRVKLNGDPKTSLRCARQAISKNRAFFVRLDSAGMDSSLSDEFTGDGSGNVYSVEFDS